MSVTTGPFTLAAGGQLRVTLPPATLVVKAVILTNLGTSSVEVNISGSSRILLPGSADLFGVSTSSGAIVITSLGTSASTITATWLTPDEIPASGYPYGAPVTNLSIEPGATVKITGPVTISGPVTVDVTGLVTSIGQLTSTTIPMQAVVSQTPIGFFGSGTTGTVTLSATTTLTHDVFYKSLVLSAASLRPAGWRVFCSTKASATVACVVSNNGEPGLVAHSTTPAVSVTGGLGGAAGRMKGGAAGGNASITASTGAITVTAGGAAPGASYGGGGGGGGSARGTGTNRAFSAGGAGNLTSYVGVPTTTQLVGSSLAGGGGGGAAGSKKSSNEKAVASGGGGGGVVFFAARTLEGPITFQAKGGAGALESYVTTQASSGGGGGGVVALFAHHSATWTGSVAPTPGPNGTPVTTPPPTPRPSPEPGTRIVIKTVEGKLKR